METEFHDMLFTRHSIRRYTDEKLTAEQVRLIMEAALLAPTSKSKRPWEFVVVDDRETLSAMAACKPFGAASLGTCAMAVAVCADPGQSDVWIEDATVAATFMQMQAEVLGLGSCWVQVRARYNKANDEAQDIVRQALGIPGEQQVECIITFGHKNEVRKPVDPAKLLWEKVHIGKF